MNCNLTGEICMEHIYQQ